MCRPHISRKRLGLVAAHEQLSRIGIDAYRRPGHGWVKEENMRVEVKAMIEALSPSEADNIKRLIKILKDNGGFPLQSPILDLLQ